MYVKGLNTKLQVLCVHMTFGGKNFNKVNNYVKKLKEVRLVRQAKVFTKKHKSMDNFCDFYSRGPRQQVYSSRLVQ